MIFSDKKGVKRLGYGWGCEGRVFQYLFQEVLKSKNQDNSDGRILSSQSGKVMEIWNINSIWFCGSANQIVNRSICFGKYREEGWRYEKCILQRRLYMDEIGKWRIGKSDGL